MAKKSKSGGASLQGLLVDVLVYMAIATVLLLQMGCVSGPNSDSIMRVCRAVDAQHFPTGVEHSSAGVISP